MEETSIKKIACIMTSICIEQSKLKQLCENKKVPQQEFDAIQKQTSDRLYTMLTYLLTKSNDEYTQFMESITDNFALNWTDPDIDNQLLPNKNNS